MSRIIIFYFIIYSAIHFVIYLRLRPLWPRRKKIGRWYMLWAAAMILAPVAARTFDITGYPWGAWLFSWVGFLWMGFILLTLFLSLALWAVQLVFWTGARLMRLRPPVWPGRILALGLVLSALGLAIYSFGVARDFQVQHLVISTAKLPAGWDRLKIAMICDLHLSPIMGPARVRALAAKVNELKPDILVAVGDIVDRNHGLVDEERNILAGISAPVGKYAILGNHEFYVGAAQSQDFLERAGFLVLRNRAVSVDGLINLAGVDDPARSGRSPAEKPVLAPLQNGLYTIFLKHRPAVDESSLGLYDLQLSGHTHGGQIFPFSLVVRLIHGRFPGLYRLTPRSWLHLSRGTGTWGPPMRFLVPPEITLIELIPLRKGPGQAGAPAPK